MLPVWLLTSRSPDWFAGRGRPPQVAALNTLNSTDTTERNASMLRPRPAPSPRWSSWLPVLTPRGSGRRRRRPTEARTQLVGYRPVLNPGDRAKPTS